MLNISEVKVMSENILKQVLEVNFKLEQNIKKIDEELARLERTIKIEKEYVDCSINKPTKKIKFYLLRDRMIKNMEDKFDVTNYYAKKRLKQIKKLSQKDKNIKNGTKLFKTMLYEYASLRSGLEITYSAIKEIERTFEDTGDVYEIVNLMSELKDIVKFNYERIKNAKLELDDAVAQNEEYLASCFVKNKKPSFNFDSEF